MTLTDSSRPTHPRFRGSVRRRRRLHTRRAGNIWFSSYLDFLSDFGSLLEDFIHISLQFCFFLFQSFWVDSVLSAQIVANISILSHVHVHKGKFILLHSRQLLFIGTLELLLLNYELVGFVQVVESTSCFYLLFILRLSAKNELS